MLYKKHCCNLVVYLIDLYYYYVTCMTFVVDVKFILRSIKKEQFVLIFKFCPAEL